jgi:hypothetical protein
MLVFAEEFKLLQIRAKDQPKALSTSAKVRWVITDKTKFENLVQDLSHFISGLDRLVPNLGTLKQHTVSALMLKEDLDALHDLHTTRLLQEATVGGPPHVAEAARQRLASVIQEKILGLIWSRAMDDRREAVQPAQYV